MRYGFAHIKAHRGPSRSFNFQLRVFWVSIFTADSISYQPVGQVAPSHQKCGLFLQPLNRQGKQSGQKGSATTRHVDVWFAVAFVLAKRRHQNQTFDTICVSDGGFTVPSALKVIQLLCPRDLVEIADL